MAVSTGQGTAFAEPSDSAAGGSSTSSPADNQGSADKPATKVGGRSADGASKSDKTTHRPPSKTSVTHSDKVKKRTESKADPGAGDGADKGSAPEVDAPAATPDSGGAASAGDAALSAAVPVEPPVEVAEQPATPPVSHSTGKVETPDPVESLTVAGQPGASHAAVAPESAAVVATGADEPAAAVDVVSVPAASVASTAPTQIAAPESPAPSRLVSVSDTPAEPAAPVTLASIVTDVLTWVGLGPLATHLPVPALPVGHLVEALWLAVREVHDRLSGVRPVANSVVAAAPALGSAPLSLAELLARSGVTVTAGSDGAVGVIDGTFTDTTVNSAEDAAAVLNGLASVLGASTGFATPGAITVSRIGETAPGAGATTFYRIRDSINGIPVLGSDVVLVTDGSGRVTGLFNHLDSRVKDMDLTVDRRIDAKSEAISAAATAYLEAMGLPHDLLSKLVLLATAKFDPQLVVYTGDAASGPQLQWRVTVTPAQSIFAAPKPGTTFYLQANGSDATKVMLATSNAQALTSSTVTAKDIQGQVRTINVSVTNLIFLRVYKLQDLTRNLTTYKVKFGFFGLGPVFPSSPLSKGWFGWNAEAVTAQANVAEVYDYYENVLGLASINGSGAPVKIYVNYNPTASWASDYDNAYWDATTQRLVFGDGADLEGALDVVAHEYTHAVISYILGSGGSVLDYGESGSLNEAYADLLGLLIEGKTDAGKWLIGEDSTFSGGLVRNIANPGAVNTAFGPYRVDYNNRYTDTGDDGGEHVNSTIFSHAMYKAMTDPATAGITSDTWAKVLYQSLHELSLTANFADGRAAILFTAGQPEFGFTTAQLNAISQAFDAAGIMAPAVLTV